jgi:hypothetical protein
LAGKAFKLSGRKETIKMRKAKSPGSTFLVWGFLAAIGSSAPLPPAMAVEAPPRGKSGDFMRFVEGKPGEGKLETAIATYAAKDGVEVDLVAAVHVADAAYYKALEERFKTYQSLLYEMVKPRGADPSSKGRSDNLLTFFQRSLKDVLGLEFQLDAIDYGKKNFVHADLDPDTFFQLQREKGENMVTLLFKAVLKELEREAKGEGKERAGALELLAAFASEDSSRALKLIFARELEDMEMILAGFEDGKEGGSVIVAERNKVVLEALRKALKDGKKKIGIFYGAGHMQDLEKRLTGELGMKKTKVEWVTAWDIKRKPLAGKARPEKGEAKGEKEKPSKDEKGAAGRAEK